MKLLKSLLIISVFIFGIACEFQEEPQIKNEYSFYITGIKESLTYTFNSGNERVQSSPDSVRSLTVLIVNEFDEIVYENRYYEWSIEGPVPDSIFIPSLPEGDYTIYAVTADYYCYWGWGGYYPEDTVYYSDSTYYKGDSANTHGCLVLEPYIVNESPIYVGSVSFTLTEDEQHVVIQMKNISAKITFACTESISGWLEIGIESQAKGYYDFKSGTFLEGDYANYIYGFLEGNAKEKSIYVLPQTLNKVNIFFYDYYSNFSISPSIALDPAVPMNIGDAITFNIDVNALLAGSGSGLFEWEDITWNDLGEITIP